MDKEVSKIYEKWLGEGGNGRTVRELIEDAFMAGKKSRQVDVSGSLPLLEDAAELKRIKDGLHKIFEDEEPGRGLPINIYCLLYPNECGNDR